MLIGANLQALRSVSNLQRSNKKATSAIQKLATGLRINRAADDAAGLAISQKMIAQIRGLGQAARNIQDGLQYLATADGYIASIQDPPLQRLRELAIQAANDTLSSVDRQAIQLEIEQTKEHLRDIFRAAEFNTRKIFAQDIERAKEPIPGLLPGDTLIKQYGLQVVSGKNDWLTFRLNGQPYEIRLAAGMYSSAQLQAALNQKFEEAKTDITVSFEGDSLVFHSPSGVLDSFGGTMINIDSPSSYTSIIYDISKPGFIYGASYVGKADITNGITFEKDSTLTFKVGNGEDPATTVNITFKAGKYSKQEILDTLNEHFTDNNIPVTASQDSSYRSLKLQHNTCGAGFTLSGLTGTAKSVLLDYSYTYMTPSTVTPRQGNDGSTATLTGLSALSTNIIIEENKNDILRFTIDGVKVDPVRLKAGSYSRNELVEYLNGELLANENTPLVAKLDTYNRLQFAYKEPGSHSVGRIHGTAAYDLFGTQSNNATEVAGSWTMKEGDTTPIPKGYATVTGLTSLTSGVQIVNGYNDTLSFILGNEQGEKQHTIKLNEGWYSKIEIVGEINKQLVGLDVSASLDYSDRIKFTHKKEGGGIDLFPYSLRDFSGTAYDDIMGRRIPTSYVSGQNASKSYVEGAKYISSSQKLQITDGENDELILKINGESYEFNLAEGSYDLSALMNHLNDLFLSEGIDGLIESVSSPSSSYYLRIQSKIAGSSINIQSIQGSAVQSLFQTVYTSTNYTSYNPPNSSDTYIDGRMDLDSGIVIGTGINDVFEFDLRNDGEIERKSVTLDSGEYSPEALAEMLNEKFKENEILVNASVKSVLTPTGYMNVLSLTYSPGRNGYFSIDGVGGTAAYSVFYPGPFSIKYDGGEKVTFQIGANSGATFDSGTQFLMNLEILGIDKIDMTTKEGAQSALIKIDHAMDTISGFRGDVGAKANALEFQLNNVTNAELNLTAAETRIRDIDMAKEIMNFQKNTILSRVTQSILAQANQQPQYVLQLLN